MANESTYSDISTLVGNVYAVAVHTARDFNIMAPLVSTWRDLNDSRPRIFAEYSGGTFGTLAETSDASSQAFTPSAAGTATPSLYSQQIFLTDRRVKTDPMAARNEAGTHLGQTAAAHVDTTLCGTAIFGGFTGGTVGTAAGTLTWGSILYASALLRKNKVPQPYHCVLTPLMWYYLNSPSSGIPSLMVVNDIATGVLGQFYQGSFSGINFFVDANIPTSTAGTAAMFNPQAVYLDMRAPFSIEPQRDASRGGGGWELNATMEYVGGIWRPTFGCRLIGVS